jgi:hypothetical protein
MVFNPLYINNKAWQDRVKSQDATPQALQSFPGKFSLLDIQSWHTM